MSAGQEQPFYRIYKVPRKDFIAAGSTMGAAITSSWVDCSRYDRLHIAFDCTHGAGATTALTGYFETSADAGTTACRLQTSSVVAGLETLADHSFTKAFTGDIQWAYALTLPCYDWIRLVLDAQEAADLVTCDLILGKG